MPPMFPSASSSDTLSFGVDQPIEREELEESVDKHEEKPYPEQQSARSVRRVLAGIEVPPLTSPKSSYSGHRAPLPKTKEYDALKYFLKHSAGTDAELDLVLDDFVVYRDAVTGGRQLGFTPLNDVAIRLGNATFFFDAIIRDATNPEKSFYLERLSFNLVSIGGYEELEQHSVGDDLWIQSTHCRSRDIWYRLGRPAKEYQQHHKLFIWLANLAKYLVDYLNNHVSVTLNEFRCQFTDWLSVHHGSDPDFVAWLSSHGKSDFRQTIVSHSDFLLKQACDMDSSYANHPIWRELDRADPIIKKQPMRIVSTVVTPFVHRCFKNMVWSSHLKLIDFDPQNKMLYKRRLKEMKFQTTARGRRAAVKPQYSRGPVPCGSFTISPGDVVATTKDEDSAWKGESEDLWYALVQDIQTYKNKPARLHVIWLYKPADTVCADLTYPYDNELFLSDHCNCEEADFDISQVATKANVSFFADQAVGKAELFIRQTYNKDDQTFTTLKDADFCCPCRRVTYSPDYAVGDTVLVETPVGSELRLRPTEIVEIHDQKAKVRQLLQRNRDFNILSSRPNELVYTDRYRFVSIEQIVRPCHVRFYTEDDVKNGCIPAPYSRDGNGDAFYITVREIVDFKGVRLERTEAPKEFKLGYDPLEPQPRLRALNIFSGGGNFDRGLEEGGAIQSEWAVEWGIEQMLTYRANHTEPNQVKLFCGSVNDYLEKALRGKDSGTVANLGDVQFISAGSPCQGYSMVNPNKMNEVSMRNCSMVASVAAFVDFYRPKYAILENVPSMASSMHKENPLSQLLCSFVGMGYQVRILNLDAWSFGAPQSRSRLFVVIAAPGLKLPSHPPLTHAHPAKTSKRSLGGAPNGLPFGERQFPVPVYDFVSASEGTKDLPLVGKGHVVPIFEPEHRSARTESTFTQNIINNVPKFPRTMGLQDALKRGWILSTHGDSTTRNLDKQKTSRSWSRVDPDHLLPTITTGLGPSCRFTGRCVHWSEDRLITLKEARRAQGFPDSEVIIGSPGQRWKIIGNSVARQVALALGMVMREACLSNTETGAKGEEFVSNIIPIEAAADDVVELTNDSSKPSGSKIVALRRLSTVTTTTTTTTTTMTSFDFASRGPGSSTSVSPDPISGINSRKRSLQEIGTAIVDAPPSAKKLKEC